MKDKSVTLLCVGDIILGDHSDVYFEHVRSVLAEGDLVIGQLEVPYTARDEEALRLERHPDNLYPLVSAGFDVLSLAGNHLADAGYAGIEDTINWLREHQISPVGAGMNLAEARQPVIVERGETKIGILKYNCVGPPETWATATKPGGAYVKVITHYELEHANPGGPPAIYTWAEPQSLRLMIDDIRELRETCDVLIVSFHKGLVHQPVKLAEYEQQVAYAAIDAGADLIISEHAHLLKGIEIYKGKTIFHGLCNFVAYVPSLFPNANEDRDAWSKRRMELFGFRPDPDYPTYPFHPEAIYTIIAKSTICKGKIIQSSYIPCLVNKEGKPVPVDKRNGGQQVFDYMQSITRQAGLHANFEWSDGEIIIFDADKNV